MTQKHIPHFDGVTYIPELDHKRQTNQMHYVKDVLKDGRWHTIDYIHKMVEMKSDRRHSQQGISARVRDLRKKKFGGLIVERKRQSGGTFLYRLVIRQGDMFH